MLCTYDNISAGCKSLWNIHKQKPLPATRRQEAELKEIMKNWAEPNYFHVFLSLFLSHKSVFACSESDSQAPLRDSAYLTADWPLLPVVSLLIGSSRCRSTSHHCLGGAAQTEIIFFVQRLRGEQPVTDRRSCELAGGLFGSSWLPLMLMDVSSLKKRQWAGICYRMVLRKRLKWCLCSGSISAAGAL